jgi:Inverse autotransporter, beta-domain
MRRLLPLLLTCMQLSALWSPDNSWQPYLEVEGQFGNYRKGAGLLSWTPLVQDQRQVGFMQVELGNFRDVWDGSIGFGYRSLIQSNLGFGVNLFGDFARSPERTHYLQGGLGAELFSHCWLVRTNGYLADSRLREDFSRTSFVFIEGLEIFSRDRDALTRTQGYSGFDIEGGAGFDLCWGELWGYLTYFRFTGRQVPAIQGPRARLEWFWNNAASIGGSRVTLAAEWDYTKRHGNTVSGYASVRFPLGTCNPTRGVCRLMSEPVIRERSIWVDDNVRVTNPLVDLNQKIFFVEEREDIGAGTQLNPTNLTDAVNSAGPNDIIFLLGDEGDITAIQIPMQDGQQLYGFDSAQSVGITVAGGRTLTVDNITAGPVPPVLDGSGLGATNLIELANNNTIFGIDILNGTAAAINGLGKSNATIGHVNITNQGGSRGIVINNTDNVLMETIGITNSGSAAGILVVNGSDNVDIRNLTMSGSVSTGIDVITASNLSLSGATLTGATDTEIFLGLVDGEMTLASVIVNSTATKGIELDMGNANYRALDSTLTFATGDTALSVEGMQGNVNLDGLSVTATDTASTSVVVEMNNGPVTLGPLNISNLTSQIAVDVNTNSGAVTLTSLSATNISGGGSQALFVKDQSGPFTATASDLETTNGNPVLELNNVNDADVLVTNLTAVGTGFLFNRAVVITNTNGGITITNGSITNAANAAFEVTGGSPSISYTGAISNDKFDFINVTNTTGGSIIFTGSSPGAISGNMGRGVQVLNAASNFTLRNADIQNTSNSGVTLVNTTGDILVADSTIGSTTVGFFCQDLVDLTLQEVSVTGITNQAIQAFSTNVDGTMTIEQNCVFSSGFQGILLGNNGTSNFVFTCVDSLIQGGSQGFIGSKSSSGGSLSVAIGRCTFDNNFTSTKIDVSGNNSSVAYNISDNTFVTTVGEAHNALFQSDGSAAVTVNGLFSNNGTVATTQDAVVLGSALMGATDQVTVSVQNTGFTSTADKSAVAFNASDTGIQNVSMLSNQHTAVAGTSPGYEIATTGTPTVCATILDNNSNQTTGINLDNGGGILSVTNAAILGSLNSGIPVTTSGTITDLGALLCPSPTVPPIPSGS